MISVCDILYAVKFQSTC